METKAHAKDNTSRSAAATPRNKPLSSQRQAVQRAACQTLEDRRLFSFSAAVPYPTGDDAQSVIAVDVNGDARRDLVALNSGNSTVSVLLGNANGTFQPAVNFVTAASPRSMAVGDFNSDGKPDLVTANSSGLSVLLNTGSGAFGAPGSNISFGSDARSVAVGDFNGDGKMDLAATSSVYHPGYWGWYGYYPAYSTSSATVLIGNGTGSFTSTGAVGYGNGAYNSLAVADFNGDGKQDFAMSNFEDYYTRVFFGSSTNAFHNYISIGSGAARAVTAGDVSGDGKADLVFASVYSNAVSVMLGNGLGSFAGPQSFATGSTPASVAIADFNGDSKADVITANSGDGSLAVLLGLGAGSFQPPIFAGASPGAVSVAVGDFNGDGRPDAATANSSFDTASVLLNDGAWTSANAPRISISDVTIAEGNTTNTNANFMVTLSAAYAEPVTVKYATADGSALAGIDYQAVSGTLTFAAGQTTRTLAVPIIGDRVIESTEYFTVNLSAATNAFVADVQAIGYITDDEPRISIDQQSSVVEGDTGTTAMAFTVRLSAASDLPVSVNFSTAEGDVQDWYWNYYYYNTQAATAGVDFEAQSGTLTFAAGETSKTITVLVKGDRVAETQEAFLVRLSNATGGEIASSTAIALINDDEPYASITNSVTKQERNSGTTAFVFTVALSAPAGAGVTVNYTTVDGSATASSGDYQAATSSITFAAGQTSQTITVLVNGDRLPEYDESFYLQLTGADGATISSGWGYATLQDDEPRLSVNSVSKLEGNSGTSTLRFTVSLAAAYDQPVSVNFKTVNGTATAASDYQAKSGTLTFAAGETSKFVDVVIYGDTAKETDEYFYIQLTGASSNALIYTEYGAGYITNDDTKPGKGNGKNK